MLVIRVESIKKLIFVVNSQMALTCLNITFVKPQQTPVVVLTKPVLETTLR
jgi:hypothetical protein